MKLINTDIKDVKLICPDIKTDYRGSFFESYQYEKYIPYIGDITFIQDNESISKYGVLRGLHYQINPGQAKLVRVTRGEVFDVVLDIRKESPTYGHWWSLHLSEINKLQLYIPRGFAHGFCVLSESVEFLYKCSDYYAPENERGIMWNDPDLAIDWPIENPILSEKDNLYPPFNQL